MLEVRWSFVEWSCPSILWCHYLLLPWCYRHENWHVTSSHIDDVTVILAMTSHFRKCGRWFSSLDPDFLTIKCKIFNLEVSSFSSMIFKRQCLWIRLWILKLNNFTYYSNANCDVTITHDKNAVGLIETKQT